MSPKSLFIIIIRIIGLYFLIDILRVLPQFLSTLLAVTRTHDYGTMLFSFLFSLLIIFIYWLIIKYMLFKPDKIVERLGLDKNFTEEKFELNTHRSTVIRIAVIIIGGMTFLDYFVPFVLNLFDFIKSRNQSGILNSLDSLSGSSVNTLDLVHGGIMILVGYFLLTNSRSITNLIERLRKK